MHSGVTLVQNTTAVQPCVNPIGTFEDYLLNNVFSTTFGFVAIQVSLVLITTGLIRTQMEEYRFTLVCNCSSALMSLSSLVRTDRCETRWTEGWLCMMRSLYH